MGLNNISKLGNPSHMQLFANESLSTIKARPCKHARCLHSDRNDLNMCGMQEEANARFDESVEVAFNLGTDPRRGDQQVRGAVTVPYGTGKTVRVGVFADGEAAELARAAGEMTLLLICPEVLVTPLETS